MAELEGIPLGLVYWDSRIPRRIVGITLDVAGKIIVASANGGAGAQQSQEAAAMLSMVAAAIERKVPIRLTGSLNPYSPPDTNYPNGYFMISGIEVFGYKWGNEYLSK
ncbi:hypothetical protein [Cupriavidus sp. D39]|uniref:hypothetical protein n=1 Tax=Cupriavidus sp. D39 TaxID=2997877 RepID=UPI002271897C|nr:hypothetical protein [Cupriavidus sp. D39]MCY0853092.1 hypothetical protein [Cupriavidus sp. D39]